MAVFPGVTPHPTIGFVPFGKHTICFGPPQHFLTQQLGFVGQQPPEFPQQLGAVAVQHLGTHG